MKCECGLEIMTPKTEIVGNEWCIICHRCHKIYRLWEVEEEKPKAVHWNYDFPVVIDGAHFPMDEAIKLANEDIGDVEDDYGKCVGIKHWWARHQFVSEDDYDDFNEDLEPGKDSLWYIQETTKRPKGVCKKVTVLEFE